MPRVTVITPTFERSAAFIPTIESVLSQSLEDIEYIIVDDGSQDDTRDIVRTFAERDPRIRLVTQVNSGAAIARQIGLELAVGEYVAFLDHDDFWRPEKLHNQVEVLEANDSLGWVYSRMELLSADGSRREEPICIRSGNIVHQLLLEGCFIRTFSNPLFRRALLTNIGGPDPAVGMCDDLDLFVRAARAAPVGYDERLALTYNLGNPASQSRQVRTYLEGIYAFQRKYMPEVHQLASPVRRAIYRRWRSDRAICCRTAAWTLQTQGESIAAAKWYARAAFNDPKQVLVAPFLKDLLGLVRSLLWPFGRS